MTATYDNAINASPKPAASERWRRVRGIVYTTFRANVFFDLSLKDPELAAIDVQVFDGPEEDKNLLYSTGRQPDAAAESAVAPLSQSNRVWLIRATPTAAFNAASTRRWVPVVTLIGVIISGLAFAVGMQQRNARRKSDTDAKRLRKEVEVRQRAEIEVRRLNQELESTVQVRTSELRAANHELEAFVYSVSHDLRAPLRAIDGFSQVVLEDHGERLDPDGIDALNRVRRASARMDRLITALLGLSRITRSPINRQAVDLSRIARDVADAIMATAPPHENTPEFVIADHLLADADEPLVTVVFDNLLRNSVKFTRRNPAPRIEVGGRNGIFWVRDNGIGFNPAHSEKLFQPFERLHSESEFPGTGIGLATVQRIIRRHGGEICADGEENVGAAFYFTLAPNDELCADTTSSLG